MSDPGTLSDDQVLQDLGLDSLMAVELRNTLVMQTGLKVPTTLVFDHPTLGAITSWLLPQLVDTAAEWVRDSGVQLIGGCCGIGPNHIAALKVMCDQDNAKLASIDRKQEKFSAETFFGTETFAAPKMFQRQLLFRRRKIFGTDRSTL